MSIPKIFKGFPQKLVIFPQTEKGFMQKFIQKQRDFMQYTMRFIQIEMKYLWIEMEFPQTVSIFLKIIPKILKNKLSTINSCKILNNLNVGGFIYIDKPIDPQH